MLKTATNIKLQFFSFNDSKMVDNFILNMIGVGDMIKAHKAQDLCYLHPIPSHPMNCTQIVKIFHIIVSRMKQKYRKFRYLRDAPEQSRPIVGTKARKTYKAH